MHTVLAKELSSNPSTHGGLLTNAYNSTSRKSCTFFLPSRTWTYFISFYFINACTIRTWIKVYPISELPSLLWVLKWGQLKVYLFPLFKFMYTIYTVHSAYSSHTPHFSLLEHSHFCNHYFLMDSSVVSLIMLVYVLQLDSAKMWNHNSWDITVSKNKTFNWF